MRPVVYAFGFSGSFIRITIGSSITVMGGSLLAVPGNRKMFPPAPQGHGNTGEWLGTDYIYDEQLRRIYAVFPAAANAPNPLSLVSMQTPEMKVDAALPLRTGPALLLSPGGERLFLSAMQEPRTAPAGVLEISTTVYGAADLKPVTSYVQRVAREKYLMAAVQNQAGFQQGAYFSRDGSVIFDRMSTLRIGSDRFERKDVGVVGLLSAEDRESLRNFERVDSASGTTYLAYAFESSASGVLLARVVDATETTEALISIDMAAQKVLSILRVPLGRATLTPDAKMILLEGLSPGADAAGRAVPRQAFKTGVISGYDPRTGRQMNSYAAESLAGDEANHRIACVDPGSGSFIYRAASRLYLVRGSLDEKPILVNTSFMAGPETSCVFANE